MQNLNSLTRQICFSYGSTVHYEQPCQLHLVGLEPGGEVAAALGRQFIGYDTDRVLVSLFS